MNIREALNEVSRGLKVSCPSWLNVSLNEEASYIQKDLLGNLVWYNGIEHKFEIVEVNYLVLWLGQGDLDWEVYKGP